MKFILMGQSPRDGPEDKYFKTFLSLEMSKDFRKSTVEKFESSRSLGVGWGVVRAGLRVKTAKASERQGAQAGRGGFSTPTHARDAPTSAAEREAVSERRIDSDPVVGFAP